jgi:hypothetical protein
MLLINMLFLGLLAVCAMLYTYQHRLQLSCMDGMMIAMVIGVMSSVSLGLNIEAYFVNDLTLSTIISVIIGMVAGYITGKFVTLMAAIDGFMAGIMGGMMSPMLGAMLNDLIVMVWFLDIVFIVAMIMIFLLVKEAREAFLKQNEEGEEIGL